MSSTFEGPSRSRSEFEAGVQDREAIRRALEQQRSEIRTIMREEMRQLLRAELEEVREEIRHEQDGKKRGRSSKTRSEAVGPIVVGSEPIHSVADDWGRGFVEQRDRWYGKMQRLGWQVWVIVLAGVVALTATVWYIASTNSGPASRTTSAPRAEAPAPTLGR